MPYLSGGYQDSPQEQQIKILLSANGFSENPGKEVKSKNGNITVVKKKSELTPGSFYYQPNGNNKSPDYLVNYNGKLYSLEAKSSKGVKPVYNGGLPQDGYIYIFSSLKHNATTIYYGHDVLSEDMRTWFKNLTNELNVLLKKHQAQLANIADPRGFDFYIRNMYIQSGGKEKIDYFTHANRDTCEQNVLGSINS